MSKKKKNNKNESRVKLILMAITALGALLSGLADIIKALK